MSTQRGVAGRSRRGAVGGVAAGVPFVALPPAGGARRAAPVVVAWHLMDPPRTESAFAAALPLEGLDAWRIYLGLPLCGSRRPPGGFEELLRLGYEDAVLNIHRPVTEGAVNEFEPAVSEVLERLGIDPGPVAVVGGSIGAAVAGQVLLEGGVDVRAAVLISPVVQLRAAVEAMERRFGVTYRWSERAAAVAARLDLVARADDIARSQPAVLLVVGDADDEEFHDAARKLRDALRRRYDDPARAGMVVVPEMGHALAEEPGEEPAPQTAAAAAVDRHATAWLRAHLAPG